MPRSTVDAFGNGSGVVVLAHADHDRPANFGPSGVLKGPLEWALHYTKRQPSQERGK